MCIDECYRFLGTLVEGNTWGEKSETCGVLEVRVGAFFNVIVLHLTSLIRNDFEANWIRDYLILPEC